MKKLLLSLLVAALAIPAIAFATPVPWDFSGSVLQPLQTGWGSQVKGNNFTSTSTTAINVFPNASSTNSTTTNATTTNLRISNGLNFNGVSGTTWTAFCTAITGGAGLCDGADATGADGVSNWLYNGSRLSPSTTVGIVGIGVFASSTIGGGTAITGLTINGNSTTTGDLIVNGSTRLATSLTGLIKGTSGLLSTASNGTDFTLISATTCGGTDKVSAITAAGVITCSPDQAGSGAGLSTSTPIASTQVIYGTSASTVGAEAAFTYDSATNILTVDSGLFTNATATNLGATGINLFGSGLKTTNNSFCIQLTGSADLCDGSDGGGGGGASDWNQAILAGVLSPTTTVGIRVAASSTFLGALTVASSSPDYRNPILKVATSSDPSGNLFEVRATTTALSNLFGISDGGHRVSIGTSTYLGGPLLDQLTLNGRMRYNEWWNSSCYNPYGSTPLSADGTIPQCPGWYFAEDSTEAMTGGTLNGFNYQQISGAVANSGAILGLNGPTGSNWVRLATNTPSMEITARIGANLANGTSTYFLIGYHNLTLSSSAMEVIPSAGCFFLASSTNSNGIDNGKTGWPNWVATCKTSNDATTTIDTGISTTTVGGGAGAWRKFRIDASGDVARFYIKTPTGNFENVATINTNIPSTTAVMPAIMFGRAAGTNNHALEWYDLDLWMRKIGPQP